MNSSEPFALAQMFRSFAARALALRPAAARLVSGPGRFLLAALFPALIAGPAAAQPFTETAPGLPEKAFPCVAVGDYDGDGDLDVLVAASGSHDIAFTTLYNNTGGTFTDSGIALLGLARATAAWGDLDGDGDLDLAMTGLESGATFGTTRVYRNNGGTFTALPGPFLGVFGGSIAWGDYDGDGDLDLLVTGVMTATAGGVAATRLYRNDGGGVFTSVPHPFPDCYDGAVAWGDYDNDGDLDVVITGVGNPPLFANIWRNNGDGTFTDAGANLPGTDLGFAAWGDYDNDGDLDLLFGGNSNDGFISRIYRNDNGVFNDANAGLLGEIWASAAWGDYDNDGDLDAMIIGYDPVAQVRRSILYRNDAGTFVNSGAVFHDVFLGTVIWMDFDNDGDLDLLLAGNDLGIDILRIYRNNDAIANAAPSAPTGLVVHPVGTSAEFSWSAAVDDHTPSAGLSYNVRLGTTPGGSEIVSPQSGSDGYRRLPGPGNAQSGLTARVGSLEIGRPYYWSVQAVDAAFAGSAFSTEGSFIFGVTGVDDVAPPTVLMLRAGPNPITGPATIFYALPAAGSVRLEIYDSSGRRVRTLARDPQGAGPHTATWDRLDERGRPVPGGAYFVRLQGERDVVVRPLVVVR
jgi:hypothetical protein